MHPWNDSCILFAALSNYVILKLMQGWHFRRSRTLFVIKSQISHWLVEDWNHFCHMSIHDCFVSSKKIFMLVDRLHASGQPAVRAKIVSLTKSNRMTESENPFQGLFVVSKFKPWTMEMVGPYNESKSQLCAPSQHISLLRPTLLCYLNYETESSIFLCNQLLISIASMSEYWYWPKLSNWSDIKGLMLHLYKCYAGILWVLNILFCSQPI